MVRCSTRGIDLKLIVQIPCFNEVTTLSAVVGEIPRAIDGVDRIEILVVDDGSTDGTAERARRLGVDHVIRHTGNKGLARTFQRAVQAALECGADIIVNTDGDNQYAGADIPKLIGPILEGKADIVVGDRGGLKNGHFSPIKRLLQVVGSKVIGAATGLQVTDAVSGFRALTRDAAEQIHIVTDFSYTVEMLMQASAKRLTVASVPVRTNPKTRPSRLFGSIPQFLRLSGITFLRTYTMYKPLRVFFYIGTVPIVLGGATIIRFIYFAAIGESGGHVQSLVLGSTLVVLGVITWLIGMIADLIAFNRKLTEIALQRIDKLERVVRRSHRQMHSASGEKKILRSDFDATIRKAK